MTSQAQAAEAQAAEQRNFITIVSGLPRSGTSMMMQMLVAGGIPPVADHQRTADDDNPKGYYEYEPVKQLKQDSSWVADTLGSVIKVIYMLLYDLPTDQRYRVVFMRRKLEEVVVSQEAMLKRMGVGGAGPATSDMVKLYEANLVHVDQWLLNQRHFEVLNVYHEEVMADPVAAARQVAEFLGGGLDQNAMAAVVDAGLHRNRRAGE